MSQLNLTQQSPTKPLLVVSLFDHSRTWANAFHDLGVKALSVDIQESTHPYHAMTDLSNPEHWSNLLDTIQKEVEESNHANLGLICAPPCTAFTRAGAWLWPEKDARHHSHPDSTGYALNLFRRCFEMRDHLKEHYDLKFWCIENPPGRLYKRADKNGLLQNELGPPTMEFHPYEYGGWWPDDPIMTGGKVFCNRSELSKRTYLWGDFAKPEKKSLGSSKALNLDNQPGKRDITTRLSSANKAARQQTPRGFATAFAHAQLSKLGLLIPETTNEK